jgi:hypothetical protein
MPFHYNVHKTIRGQPATLLILVAKTSKTSQIDNHDFGWARSKAP